MKAWQDRIRYPKILKPKICDPKIRQPKIPNPKIREPKVRNEPKYPRYIAMNLTNEQRLELQVFESL